MFAQRLWTSFKRPFDWFDYAHHKFAQGKEKRARNNKVDTITEQVRQVLQTVDQKLILMVRN